MSGVKKLIDDIPCFLQNDWTSFPSIGRNR